MNIRTAEEFNEFLSEELSWRKKEMINFRLLLSNSRTHEQEVLARAGVAILYAHWEGFIKRATTGYLNFVNLQRHKLMDLRDNFVAIAMKSEFSKANTTNKARIYTDAVTRFLGDLSSRANIDWRDA